MRKKTPGPGVTPQEQTPPQLPTQTQDAQQDAGALDDTSTPDTPVVQSPQGRKGGRKQRPARGVKAGNTGTSGSRAGAGKNNKAGIVKTYDMIEGMFAMGRALKPDMYVLPTSEETRGIILPFLNIMDRHGWIPEGGVPLDAQDILTIVVTGVMYSTRVRVTAEVAQAMNAQQQGPQAPQTPQAPVSMPYASVPTSGVFASVDTPGTDTTQQDAVYQDKMNALLQSDFIGRQAQGLS